jgi:hypothetical protein
MFHTNNNFIPVPNKLDFSAIGLLYYVSLYERKEKQMPEISEFYGISVEIRYKDHNPPHFHAAYGDIKRYLTLTEI